MHFMLDIKILESVTKYLLSSDEDIEMLGFRMFCNSIEDVSYYSFFDSFPHSREISPLPIAIKNYRVFIDYYINTTGGKDICYERDLTLISREKRFAISLRIKHETKVIFVFQCNNMADESFLIKEIFGPDRIEYL